METLILAVRFLAFSQVAFFVLAIAFSSNPQRVRWVGASLGLCALAYLSAPVALAASQMVLAATFWTMGSLIPCTILLFTRVVFDERRTIPMWMVLVTVSDIVVETAMHVSWLQVGQQSTLVINLFVAKRLVILAIAMFLLWRGRDSDLVELRAKLR